MRMQLQRTDAGNAIICALCTILIISVIAANVLMSSVTRYNVTAKQLKAWKEALYAAEAGADIGFAEVRKNWTSSSFTSYNHSDTFGQGGSLTSSVNVDKLTDQPPPMGSGTGLTYYRIRATGTAKLFGLPRVGMDDAINAGGTYFAANATTRGVGDSLLRKIDFNYDHFLATYGDGDGNGVTLQKVLNPQITRRIELIAVPTMAFSGALKVTGSFNGPGAAGVIDSYRSSNRKPPLQPYDYYPGAYNLQPSDPYYTPYYADSENGDVSVATSVFNQPGYIYGNVTTNGGNVKPSPQIDGSIDNTVAFTVPPLAKPDTTNYTATSASALTLPTTADSWGNSKLYLYSSMTGTLTINSTGGAETYVRIVVNGDVGGKITISSGVNAQIYFTGNFSAQIKDIVNNNVANAVSTNSSKPGHLQFYGISPTDGSTQTIQINPPGDLYATFYAPNGDMTLKGNANFYGAIVAHNFSGNGTGGGNTGFHYDKDILGLGGIPIDYQIASFVEDTR